MANLPEGGRRDRILDTFRHYCTGKSYNAIGKATNRAKTTIAVDLHAVQDLVTKRFMRNSKGYNVTEAIARITRVTRTKGMRAASIRDWHALRTTFVTLALSAGVPLELVRRITGHSTADIVLKHYFRPDREQFRAALTDAMPDILTGKTTELKPADEFGALAKKVAAGSATTEDKERMAMLLKEL